MGLKQGEDYSKVFAGKLLDERLMWDDTCKMCTRFHVKKVCYKDCKFAASHKPDSQVPENKKKEMRGFCQKCRAL